MSMSVDASSNPLSYLQTLLQQGTTAASNAASAGNPLDALFESVTGLGTTTDSSTSTTSNTADGSILNAFDSGTLSTLLATQDQSTTNNSTGSILFNRIDDGKDMARQADSRNLPGAGGAGQSAGSGAAAKGGSANSLLSATTADGAAVQTETNPDGSTTTVTTYPDGSTATSTTAALPNGDGTSNSGTGNQSNSTLAAQWTQLQSQLLSAAASTLSILI